MPFRFPNESDEYRTGRDALLDAEVELRAHSEAVAQQRRALPLGGKLGGDYRFEQVRAGEVSQVPFAELFGEHEHLLLYTMMFGREWDAPCPSCTSFVDGMNSNWYAVDETTAIAVVADAGPQQLLAWAEKRGWTIPLFSGGETSFILDYAGFDATDPAMCSILNAFRRTDDGVYHTWGSELLGRPMESGHPRHVDPIWPMWNLLDASAGGRGDAIVPRQDFEHRYFSKVVLGQDVDGGDCCH
ncbi:MAG: DUF899 family protein [Planctomycetota bacterium]|nr:DUF899 family protein [Planctomycetota bacterium]